MEEENKEVPPFEIRSSKEAIYKALDGILKQVTIAAQKDIDELKVKVQGIADAIRLQHEQQSNKPK
jgi:hypothetical protein